MAVRGIASRLALWVLAGTMLVIVTGGLLLFRFMGHQILEQTHRESEALASDGGNRIQQRLDKVTNSAQMLASLIGPRPDDAQSLIHDVMQHNPDLAGLAAAYIPHSTAAATTSGSPFISRRDDGTLLSRDMLQDPSPYWDWPWFRTGLTCIGGCWQQPFFSQSRHRKLVNYSVAILANRQVTGVLNADVTLDWLQGVLSGLNKPPGGEAFVIDQQGIYLASDNPGLIGQQAKDGLLDVFSHPDAKPIREMTTQISRSDDPVWIYHSPIKGTQWQFILAIPESWIYASVQRAFLAALGIGGLALLAMTVLVFVITRRVMNPLGVLTERAEQVARGALDFTLPKVRQHDEIGRLTHAFDRMRLDLAEHLAERTRVAREQQRLTSELEIAQQIQTALLPGAHYLDARCSNFELHAVLQPARTVGGDLYSYFMLHDQRLYIIVGDVSDKGIPAALFMARAITLAKAMAPRAQSPQQLLQLLNEELCRNNDGCMFVSLLCGLLDTISGQLIMASAGHEPPVLWGRDVPRLLEFDTGPALGLDEEATYPVHRLRLRPGDNLLMYTDGITEATDHALQMYGQERMLACLARYAENEDGDPAGYLVTDVESFAAGRSQADDITVLALRWHHAGPGRSASMLDVIIDASMDAVFDMLERCDRELHSAGIDPDVRHDVRLVLEELMVNMVQHGREEPRAGQIGLRLTLSSGAIMVELHHDGQAFDPLQSPPILLTGDIADRDTDGGLGVHLVRAMASDLNYAHDAQGNHLQLRFIYPHKPE
ncbi:IcfG protein [Dyella lipolytica]|uniref:SpoIIE family protein phosphatase n=1 Tax=Dyella lipolytica TaxID=1867835 RepID=A0ABW8IVB2_9GAMM|nr:SpoIIE family protein phosphatase [Dyella lipolytica]GLQ47803.1 IcfG protein [Dyella lipolytica]